MGVYNSASLMSYAYYRLEKKKKDKLQHFIFVAV